MAHAPQTLLPGDDKFRHDVRNQLAIIRGFSEVLLGETTDTDPRRSDLEAIHTAAMTALDLLERLEPPRCKE